MEEREVFNVPQAAAFVGVSSRTMYDWIHIATFPAVKVGGRVLILRESLIDWLRAQEQNH